MTLPDFGKMIDEEIEGLKRFAKGIEWSIKMFPVLYPKVKDLYEAGDIVAAQKIILDEIEKQESET